ncbi:hypothetical protein [Mycobacterium sp.]|uniref:WXG100-like domain-containing protein n=1 Tax=Mycobacterium sp. TaxID=1785 RepID=UPI003BAB276C
MAPLAVDPEALSAAGSSVAAVGGDVAAALGPLTAGFSANTGQDAAGEVFGLAYQDTAEALLNAAAAGINALRRNGAKIRLSASNYSVAEATSTVGGGADVLAAPAEPEQFVPPGPPATLGPGVVAPVLWAVVQSLVGDLWPNGDAAGIRAAAGHWRGFAATLNGVRDALNAPKAVVAAQDIPEGALIEQVLSAIGTDLASVGEQCGKLATALENFANEVANTQDAIRNLLDRLGSVSGLWDQVVSFLEGHLLDEVHESAEDIQAVLHNMGRQAKAREQQMQLAIQILDGVVVGMQRHVRGQLTRFLGEEVGNPLATVFDTYTNTQEGFVKAAVGTVQGLEQLDPQRLLTDPEGAAASWKAMTKTGLLNHILNPQDAAQADRDMAKGLLHLEDWRRDRPGLGLGGNLFDVASVAIPGVGGAGAGARGVAGAARGAEAADAAAAAGRGGRVVGEAGELTGVGGAVDDIGQAGHGLSRDLRNLSGELPINDPPSGGRPVGLPAEKSPQVPVEPTPRPVESVPLDKPAPESPTTSPGSGVPGRAEQPRALYEPTAVSAAPSHPTWTPTPAGEHVPPTGPHVVEPAPASPGGSLVSSEPAPGHWAPVPAPAESKAPAPPINSPASHPTQLAPPHGGDGGAHGLSDGSPPGGGQHEPGKDSALSERETQHGHEGAHGERELPGSGVVDLYQLPSPELVTPPTNRAFFWSGRTSDGFGIGPESAGGTGAADLFATSHGGTTLEGLLDRNSVKPPKWSFDDPSSQEWWSKVSGMYAENVQGEVHAVVGSNLRPGNVWEAIELPRLMDNPNVTKIVVIDPETGNETTIFKR